jgi:hypothetical protein
MVRTSTDILDINPLERMDRLEDITNEKKSTIASKRKELEELEQSKKKELEELDQKKRKELEELDKRKKKGLEDLDNKRKELQDLETQKLKEIEETEELIDKSFQELMRHKRILLQEEDDSNRKKKSTQENQDNNKEINLEDVANTASNIAPKGNNMDYGKFFENLQTPQRIYEVTNQSFYGGLKELRNRAANGEITPEEELFIDRLKNQFEQFNNELSYIEKDQNQYVKRSMQVIEQIGKYRRLKSE